MAGAYTLELPDRENRDRAGLSVLVAPGQRRAGLGTALLRHATARARALGRVRMSAEVIKGTPGDGFARAVGATAELTEARRTLDVRAIPSGRWASCARRRRARRPGTRCWPGRARRPRPTSTRWPG